MMLCLARPSIPIRDAFEDLGEVDEAELIHDEDLDAQCGPRLEECPLNAEII